MAKKTRVSTVPGVHPNEVARLFEVHKRTPFRWIAAGRIPSKNGLVDGSAVALYLPQWQTSCSLWEARKKLGISAGTLSAWRKKGFLVSVTVMGFERVTLESVAKMKARPRRRVFSPRAGFDRRNRLLVSLGIGSAGLKEQIRRGAISTVLVDGQRLIPAEEIERIESVWRASCYPAAARRILAVSKSEFGRLTANGRAKEIVLLGRRRILLARLARTPDEKERLRAHLAEEKDRLERRREAALRGYWAARGGSREEVLARKKEELKRRRALRKAARGAGSRRTRLISGGTASPKRQEKILSGPATKANGTPAPPTSVYAPRLVHISEFGSRRLTTCDEVAKAIGKSVAFVEDRYQSGSLRGLRTQSGQIVLFMSSAEILIQRFREGAR